MANIKVVLFGLNYENSSISSLPGCINDVETMKKYLQRHIGVPSKNIDLYHDHTEKTPTREVILTSLASAVAEVNSSENALDTLWVQYSGHGSYVLDENNDEVDGYDEVLCPVSGEFIRDDTLNTVFSGLDASKKLVCIFDCCHSGTALDLPWQYNHEQNRSVKVSDANAIQCDAILLSGCRDDQTAADVSGLLKKYTYNGAFTSALLKTFRKSPQITIDQLFTQAYDFLRKNFLGQSPQVSSTREITPSTELVVSAHRVNLMQKRRDLLRKIRLCRVYYLRTRRLKFLRWARLYQQQLHDLFK